MQKKSKTATLVHASSLTEQRFSRHFDTYDQQAAVQALMAQRLVSRTAEYVGTLPLNILEIGCGTGLMTKELCRYVNIARYCGNDIVHASELKTRMLFQTLSGTEFSFITADASQLHDLPFVPDIIISGASFQWIQDLPAFIQRLHQFLPQGGVLSFSSFGPRNYKEILLLTGIGLDYLSVDQWRGLLAGRFEILESDESVNSLIFNSPAEVLRHIRETGVNGITAKRWTRQSLASFCDQYSRRFETASGIPLTYHPLQIIAKKI